MAIPVITEVPVDSLALSPPTESKNGQMKICYLTQDGTPLIARLSTGLDATTPFPPSVYNGTGYETRKGIIFHVPERARDAIVGIEDFCKAALRTDMPSVDMFWNPACKTREPYGAQLKAKINVGDDAKAVKFYDASGNPAEPPSTWHRMPCNGLLNIRGVYCQRNAVGLIIDVSALQHEATPVVEVACPF